MDIAGVDVLTHVARTLSFELPAFVGDMIARGMTGAKAGRGFYEKRGDEILTLDPRTLEYRPKQPAKLPSLETARSIEPVSARIRKLYEGKDKVGAFLRATLGPTLEYSAKIADEIAYSPADIDKAMRWGFGWELGPFEVWDAIGVERSVAKLKEEGKTVPPNVQQMLDSGAKSFYKQENGQRFYFDFPSAKYVPASDPPGTIILKSLKDRGTGANGENRRPGSEQNCATACGVNSIVCSRLVSQLSLAAPTDR